MQCEKEQFEKQNLQQKTKIRHIESKNRPTT